MFFYCLFILFYFFPKYFWTNLKDGRLPNATWSKRLVFLFPGFLVIQLEYLHLLHATDKQKQRPILLHS